MLGVRQTSVAQAREEISIRSCEARRRSVFHFALYCVVHPGPWRLLLTCLVRHAINDTTISRKHLVIEVGRVKLGDGVRLDSIIPPLIHTDSFSHTSIQSRNLSLVTKPPNVAPPLMASRLKAGVRFLILMRNIQLSWGNIHM